MEKAHDHIGDLNAGVIDVVLYIDFLPGSAQQAHERVAENRITQVTNVRGLIGIDAGVLHQRVKSAGNTGQALTCGNSPHARGAIQTRVDVTGAGNFKSRKTDRKSVV